MSKITFSVLGALSLAVGVVFLFVPILPTIPFLAFAAYCFSKASPRLSRWLATLPYVGPLFRDGQLSEGVKKALIAAAILALALGGVVAWLMKRH